MDVKFISELSWNEFNKIKLPRGRKYKLDTDDVSDKFSILFTFY